MSIKLQSQMVQVTEAEKEIHVKGFSKGTDEKALMNFFTTGFGIVKSLEILKDVEGQAIVQFLRPESVTNATQSSNKVFLQGCKLTITARRPLVSDKGGNKKSPLSANKVAPAGNPKRNNPPSTPVSKAVSDLKLTGSFENQLSTVHHQILLNQQEYSKLLMVARVLEDVLQDTFPGCRVLCFGSAISGLAFKGSDLDCFVRLPEHLKKRICFGRSSQEAQLHLVNRTKKRLFSFRNIFGNIVSIPSARIPIVKFIHRPTGDNCDVSFKNLFGISNTFLIKFLLSTDRRLLPLFTFIKYWAKTHDIVASGKMTSYSMILLIIFYLQQLDEPVIPPLMKLQRDRTFDIYEEGWNCGFDLSYNNFPRTRNVATLSSLVLGFFHYYSEYNFATHVVCTLTGESIEKSQFLDANNLPPALLNYVISLEEHSAEIFPSVKSMCVQDPIVLSTNTTRGVSANLLHLFQTSCDQAIVCISTELDKNNGESLIAMLLQKTTPVKMNVSKQATTIKMPESVIAELNRKAAAVEQSSSKDNTTSKTPLSINSKVPNAILIKLCDDIAKILIDIFENVLKCTHQGNVNVNSVPTSDNIANICFQCTVTHNVWDELSTSEPMAVQSSPAEITEPLFHFSINMRPLYNGDLLRLK